MDRNRNNPPSQLAGGRAATLAKLSLPRLAQGIARPRLFAVLDEARQGAGTWIAAPGGAGKTTLAATYLIERKLPYLWYQLDRDDADPATFFYYLGIAARQVNPAIHLPLLTPEYLPDIPGFTRRYFRNLFARLPAGLVLVLDNYQDLGEAPLFAEMLRNVLEEIRGAHLMILSRSGPARTGSSAAGVLIPLDWETLRLTYDETRAIVAHSHALDEASLHALHRRADGWPAGVTLLLEQIEGTGSDITALDVGTMDTVFHFFAGEFFNQLPEITRVFLLKTALLSHMTPSLAVAVTGNQQAGYILGDLHRRHFFTHRRDLGEVSYQYHALFREFLLAKLVELYSGESYLVMIRHAAAALIEWERREEAVGLYLQAKDWEMAIPLLLDQAPSLLDQGRAQTVATWLQRIPEPLVESAPWLMYWKGISQQFINPFSARELLENAYTAFVSENDVLGQMLVASAVIDSIYMLRLSFVLSRRWIEVLQKYLELQGYFPSAEIEARLLTSLLSALMFCRAHDCRLPRYAARLMTLIDEGLNVNQRINIAGHLLYYHALVGRDIELCNIIILKINRLVGLPDVTAVNEIFWRHMCIYPLLMIGRFQEAYEINRGVQRLIEKHDLKFMRFIANVYNVGLFLNGGEIDRAKVTLDQMKSSMNPEQPLDTVWYLSLMFVYVVITKDRESLLAYGATALSSLVNIGLMTTANEIRYILVLSCYEHGLVQEANDYLAADGDGSCISLVARHRLIIIEAYSALLSGDNARTNDRLKALFSDYGRQPFFGSFFFWYPDRVISRLCAEALRAGIEVACVREIIRKRKLLADNVTFEGWPWPVKIYTLGQFRVEVDNREVSAFQSQGKPIALLVALVALGGSDVRIDHIAELLWPDADGDAALSTFTTTLSRLRKLIGDEVVIVQDRRVSLDERRCWLDVRALEYHLDRAAQIDNSSAALGDWSETILNLYRGPFLANVEEEWAQRLRRRLREQIVCCMSGCVDALRAIGDHQAAASLLERTMAADPNAVAL